MKTPKHILLLLFVFAVAFANAQTPVRTVKRINLNEKANLNLKQIPELLLEATCRGELTAYYPHLPQVPVEFSTIANYFYITMPQPEVTNGYFIDGCCGSNELCDIAAYDVEKLKAHLEVVEDAYNTPSGLKTEVVYVRLIFTDYYGNERGPLFHYKDVKDAGVSLKNPINGLHLPLAQILENHLLNSYTFSNRDKLFTIDESTEQRKQNANRENDYWEN